MSNQVHSQIAIIGAGPGGYVAALELAKLGKEVTVIEKAEVGGICLHSGCIPSKSLINIADKYNSINSFEEMGISVQAPSLDFAKCQEWKGSVTDQLTNGIKQMFKKDKIKLIYGQAKFLDNQTIAIDANDGEDSVMTFDYCIIATGSRPIEIANFPFGDKVLSSTELLSMDHVPESLVVIGGGYIGIELSQVYAKFGSKISIIEATGSILPGFDSRTASLVKRNLKKAQVDVYTDSLASGLSISGDRVEVSYQSKGEVNKITADFVAVTVGRRPNTDQLGLENTNVAVSDRGLIEVDDQARTSVNNIFAIGDITQGPALAHKASYDAKTVAKIIGLDQDIKLDYSVLPFVVFSDPEIATVGLTEVAAKEKGIDVGSGRAMYGANGRAMTVAGGEGSVNLVFDRESLVIIGAQIIGINASDMIAECALAVKAKVKISDLAMTIHAHPTLSEIIQEAAEDGLRSI